MKNLKKISLILFMAIMSIPAFSQQGDFDKTLKDAEAGNTEAMYDLAILYYKGNEIAKDYSKAKYWFEKAAEKENTAAMNYLGNIYLKAEGVSKDYSKAIYWYEKAAEKGNSVSMYNLGKMYVAGIGVSSDVEKGYEWYTKAAENGHIDAMVMIGQKFLLNKTSSDYSKAFNWFNKASRMGKTEAMYYLGFMYENGFGTTKNESKAKEWYKSAESGGTTGGMISIASLYYYGMGGVSVDKVKGRYWLQKACKANNKDACAALDKLEPEAKTKAETIAWIKENLEKYGGWENDEYGKVYYEDVMVSPCKITFTEISSILFFGEKSNGKVLKSFNPSLVKEWISSAFTISADSEVIETYNPENSYRSFSSDFNLDYNEREPELHENMIKALLHLGTFCEK